MDTFEDLGLTPELVEALAAEGVERPTPLQEAAVPLIRRGGNVVASAGPGAGTLVAYGAPLLDRISTEGGGGPRALVLTPSSEDARLLAESLGRLARATGHAVASVGGPWVLPERADVLFGTPSDVLGWVGISRLDLAAVEAVVVDGAQRIQRTQGLDGLEALLAGLPAAAQRVVVSLPLTSEVDDLCERHLRRAVHVPPRAASGDPARPPERGELRYRIVTDREEGALELVAEVLESDDARHACLFVRSEDRAADVGDFLTLHGFVAGRPGDAAVPVWLAVDDLEARRALDAAAHGAVVISVDVPSGADSLDRRHGAGRGGYALVLPRELAHLRDVARRTGYAVKPWPPRAAPTATEFDRLLARVESAVERDETAAYVAALSPLMERHAAAELAAAALLLLRENEKGGDEATAVPAQPGAAAAPAAFVRLYVSLGERDRVGPGDLLGAMTGEAGIDGSQVGRIEIRDSFSLVEVERDAAERIIRGLNGVTVRGRAVRVDYDRGARERGGKRPGGGNKAARRR